VLKKRTALANVEKKKDTKGPDDIIEPKRKLNEAALEHITNTQTQSLSGKKLNRRRSPKKTQGAGLSPDGGANSWEAKRGGFFSKEPFGGKEGWEGGGGDKGMSFSFERR